MEFECGTYLQKNAISEYARHQDIISAHLATY